MDIRPNFFIVGGPKCGTTAMVEYLRTHPDIFISEPKEPNYFSDNLPETKYVDSLSEYLNLFKKATNFKIKGDASVFSMFSKVAIKNIYKSNSKAKLLIMLRNPIKMVPSYHLQIQYTLEEDVEDLCVVLGLERERELGNKIPKNSKCSKLLRYSEIAKYGEQLENVYKYFPKNQVKVILFDEFIKSNRNTYREVLNFLDIEDDGRRDFPKINEAKKAKSIFISKIVNRPPKFAKVLAKIARRILNKPRLGLLSALDCANREVTEKKHITIKEKNMLLEIYTKDIKKTEEILNQDLSSWLA